MRKNMLNSKKLVKKTYYFKITVKFKKEEK